MAEKKVSLGQQPPRCLSVSTQGLLRARTQHVPNIHTGALKLALRWVPGRLACGARGKRCPLAASGGLFRVKHAPAARRSRGESARALLPWGEGSRAGGGWRGARPAAGRQQKSASTVRAPEIPAAHACRAAHPPLPAAGRWPSGASYRTTSGRCCAVRPLRARRAARGAPPSAKKGKAKRGATKMCCLPPPSARVEFDRCNKRVTH